MARIRKVRGRVVKRTPGANAQCKSCVFKMATELCSVRGAQAAIIMLSPDGKTFLVGHPCADTIAQMAVHRNAMPGIVQAQHDSVRSAGIQQIKDARDQLEALKKYGKEDLKMMGESMSQHFWKKSVHELNTAELDQMMAKIDEIIENIKKEILIKTSTARSAAKSVGA